MVARMVFNICLARCYMDFWISIHSRRQAFCLLLCNTEWVSGKHLILHNIYLYTWFILGRVHIFVTSCDEQASSRGLTRKLQEKRVAWEILWNAGSLKISLVFYFPPSIKTNNFSDYLGTQTLLPRDLLGYLDQLYLPTQICQFQHQHCARKA